MFFLRIRLSLLNLNVFAAGSHVAVNRLLYNHAQVVRARRNVQGHRASDASL
jgi:hypothetical protein